MHCPCCGPNCPFAKHSQQSRTQEVACNPQCPLVADNHPATVNDFRPLVLAMRGIAEVQPSIFGCAPGLEALLPPPINPPSHTLLSLACALTI